MSGSVFLNNLDDFIAPSQACVNPLVNAKLEANAAAAASSTDATSSAASKGPKIRLQADYSETLFAPAAKKPDLIKTRAAASSSSGSAATKVASVSLNDCLACSGCVTSAESVLIQEQGVDRLAERLLPYLPSPPSAAVAALPSNSPYMVILLLSPNSVSSLAAMLDQSYAVTFLKVSTILKALGVKAVLDASCAGDVALVESREEFLKRYKEGHLKGWSKPPISSAVNARQILSYSSSTTTDGSAVSAINPVLTAATVPVTTPSVVDMGAVPALHSHLPVLSSNCPGWVCFAEKTQPQALPYLSTVKSAQQIAGIVIHKMYREHIIAATDVKSNSDAESSKQQLYIVSIQPCFDKKLEMSRKDFYHENEDGQGTVAGADPTTAVFPDTSTSYSEVDLVLSTAELWQFIVDNVSYWKQSLFGLESESKSISKLKEEEDEDMYSSLRIITHLLPAVALDVPYSNVSTSSSADTADIGSQGDDVQFLHTLEQLFRGFSADGQSLVSATESNAGSGAYSEYLFRSPALRLFNVKIPDFLQLEYKVGRNPDMSEIDLNDVLEAHPYLKPTATKGGAAAAGSGGAMRDAQDQREIKPFNLKFARAYGFRNIQSIVMKMRRGLCDFHYVEMMACPSGCNNGGGQLKQLPQQQPEQQSDSAPKETTDQTKERVRKVEEIFHASRLVDSPDNSALVRYLYNDNDELTLPPSDHSSGSSSSSSNSRSSTTGGGGGSGDDSCTSKAATRTITSTANRGTIPQKKLGQPLSAEARSLLHTRYHAVPKLELVAPLATPW